MKKLISVTLILLSTIVIMGCAPTTSEKTASTDQDTVQKEMAQVTITLTEEDKELSKKVVEVPVGENLETILVEQFEGKAEKGMITSLAGHEQEPEDNKYWLFNINGKPSMVAANNYQVQDNDKIDWTLAVLK